MPDKFVGLMAKFPEPGKVKTRLASSIGNDKALTVYQWLLKNTLANGVRPDSTYQLGLFVHPPDKTAQLETHSPGHRFYLPQQGESLGERMLNALTCLFSNFKSKKTILIGADIPDISHKIIDTAFDRLDGHDVVFGPTDDGGYYLIGMKQLHKTFFQNIPWGTAEVLKQSISAAQSEQLSFSLLTTLKDVDTDEDLKAFPDIHNIIL